MGWRHGTCSAAARCGAPPRPLSTRPRLCDQLQHSGTLRGADVITDHGGARCHRPEDSGVDIAAARIVILFFHSHFSLFSRESFVRCARKKKTSARITSETNLIKKYDGNKSVGSSLTSLILRSKQISQDHEFARDSFTPDLKGLHQICWDRHATF